MEKSLETKAQTYLDNSLQQYINEHIDIMILKTSKQEEKIVDFKEFKNFVKTSIKDFALRNLDISTVEAHKRNVRETYMYRHFLDRLYDLYTKLPHINASQDLTMNCLNELRGGCTNSLKGETEDTIIAIENCMEQINDFNNKIKKASSDQEKYNLEQEKKQFISKFDQSMATRKKESRNIVRPSESKRPMNPEGKDRDYSTESTFINAILSYIQQKYQESPTQERVVEKIVTVPYTTYVEKPVIQTEYVEIPVTQIEYVEKPPKPKITFDGSDGLYKLENGNDRKYFRPTLSKKHIRLFRQYIDMEFKDSFPPQEKLEYDPTIVIDVNIYALLTQYDKENGSKMKDDYVKSVINRCTVNSHREAEPKIDIHYDLSEIKKSKSLGRGLSGMIKKHRIKNFASANGQDGIGIAKYTRENKARYGLLRKNISGKRGTLKTVNPNEIIHIEPPPYIELYR